MLIPVNAAKLGTLDGSSSVGYTGSSFLQEAKPITNMNKNRKFFIFFNLNTKVQKNSEISNSKWKIIVSKQ